jgi:hypothetical protein
MAMEAMELPEQPSLLDAALAYARRGWKIFPVRGKLPLVKHWNTDSTTDETQITTWFEDPFWEFNDHIHTEEIGIGLVTGTGLAVLDLDTKGGDMGNMISAVAGLTDAKEFSAPLVQTGGGGLHFYFATETEVRNKDSRGTGVRGVDVRGDGGYVVAPPSLHPSGERYKWVDWPLPDILPQWPFRFAEKAPAVVLPEDGVGAEVGTRNATLASLAGTMRRKGMSHLAIREALRAENAGWSNPLPEREVDAVAKSVSRYRPEDPVDIETGSVALNMTQFLELESEGEDWLVNRVWPESAIGFIVGPPKSFKSFFALEMAFALATGKPFLGEFTIPSPRSVLLIQEESGRKAFQERIRRAGGIYGQADNAYFISNRPYNLEKSEGLERLRVEIETHRPAMVILDPLASFVRGDENRQQEMGAFIRTIRDLRNKYDCAFCIVHHSKKGKPDDFRGSSVFHAASEVTIRISRLTEDVARSKVTFELKDGESPARMDIMYRQTTGALTPIRASQMLAKALAGDDDPHYNR